MTMLQLYTARTRLVTLFQSNLFALSHVSALPISAHFPASSVVFGEQTTVSESYERFAGEDTMLVAPVCHEGELFGALRRESVLKIIREDRWEAFPIPISSLVVRSFTVVDAQTPWSNALQKMKDDKSLAIIALTEANKILFAATADIILEILSRLVHESEREQEENSGQPLFAESRATANFR